MEEEEKKKAYSEVVEILKLIEDEERIEKIPFEVIELIKQNADPTYKPQISKEIPLEEQNLREQTYIILGWIASKYWGEAIIEANEKKESEIKVDVSQMQGRMEGEDQIQEERRNAGVYNDIDPKILNAEPSKEPEKLPILVSNLKWYQKIKIEIIKLFKFLFKIKREDNEEGVI